MRLIIRDDSDTASSYVANYIADRINHFSPTAAHPFVLGLPTGASPLGVYKLLVEKYKAGLVSICPSVNPHRAIVNSPSLGLVRKCRHFQHGKNL